MAGAPGARLAAGLAQGPLAFGVRRALGAALGEIADAVYITYMASEATGGVALLMSGSEGNVWGNVYKSKGKIVDVVRGGPQADPRGGNGAREICSAPRRGKGRGALPKARAARCCY